MEPSPLPALVGHAPAFLEVLERTSRLAALDRPVLVVGERGTGKELIAHRLHYLSPRWQRRLVALNCAALPESLLETELFGHEAGAFTGAARRRAGRFEHADGGTMFLDEIANAPLAVQEKILRVVEYGVFERVGSSEPQSCDVRIVAAANVDLPGAARAGRFREDLLDRLAFDVLTLPPLRHRRADIPILAAHFARAMAFDIGWPNFNGFTKDAERALARYPWPGNVRELKNVVERAVYQASEVGEPIDAVVFDPFDSPYRLAGTAETKARDETTHSLPRAVPDDGAVPPSDLEAAVANFEKELLVEALESARFNQRAAADAVGLGYHQFRNRLRRHGLLPKSRAKG